MNKLFFLVLFLGFFGLSVAQDDEQPSTSEEEVEIDKIPTDEQADTLKVEDIDFDDVDLDDIEEDELTRESSFPWYKVYVGGQIGGLQFGDITNIAVSPELFFKANDFIGFGLDGVYEYYRAKRINTYYGAYDANYKSKNTGGRIFTRVAPVQSFPIFAQIEYEMLAVTTPYASDPNSPPNEYNFFSVDQDLRNVNAGLGFYNGPYYINLMYNFMNKDNKNEYRDLAAADYEQETGRPTSSSEIDDRNFPNALGFRAGLNIPLGSQNKNKKRKRRKSSEPTPESYRQQ